jgi:hypothetical protein
MDEQRLRDFFLGKISGRRLARSIDGSISHPDRISSIVYVRDMEEPFTITREMAASLCAAVLHGEMPPEHLQWIGFTLEASDHFDWDEDDLLATIFEAWSSPQINWPLTLTNVRRFRAWLTGDEVLPANPWNAENRQAAARLVSITRKQPTRFPKARAFLARLIGGWTGRSLWVVALATT